MSSASVTVALAQLSDPHLRIGPGDAGPARALAAAVAAVAALDPAPAAVVVTGDLADGARDAEYERARELLAPLAMPVHVLAGNHDDRDALRRWFDVPGGAAPGAPVRYAVACGALRLVACDTTRPGRGDGALDAEQRAWLAAELDAQPDVPAIVAVHHPPLRTGIAEMDALGLDAGDVRALGALIAARPQVRRVVGGHVHRGAIGQLGGCPVLACPSTNLQARLDLRHGRMSFAPETPAFLLHVVVDGELVSHLQPVERTA